MPFDPDKYLESKLAGAPNGFDPDKYLASKAAATPQEEPGLLETGARALAQGATLGFADEGAGALGAVVDAAKKGSLSELVADYIKNRDSYRGGDDAAKKAHPVLFTGGEVAGGVAPLLLSGGAAAPTFGGRVAAAAGAGALAGLGSSKADLTEGDVAGAARDTAIGAGTGAVLQAAGEKVLGPALRKAGEKLGGAAESLAEHATGASDLPEGSGRELLDRGLVRAGSSAAGIAKRAGALQDASNAEIDAALSALDKQGVTVSRDQLLAELYGKLSQLRADESQAGVARKLEKIIEDVAASPDSRPISEVEAVKRGFQKQSNYAKPLTTGANKATASAYRGAVEDVATQADPALAETFKKAKETYGLVAPIEEAASTRAEREAKEPLIGIKDLITGHLAGVPAAIARRLALPRLASTGAVASDLASKGLEVAANPLGKTAAASVEAVTERMAPAAAPAFANQSRDWNQTVQRLSSSPNGQRFVGPLQDAVRRGGDAPAVTHYMLSQQYPEYRELAEGEGKDEP